MALAKKRHIEQAKVRVREKLVAIEQQRDGIMLYVDSQLNQAKDSATSLLQLTDRAQFMHHFRPIMQQLEECLNTLFMIQASLPADDTEPSGDDASDTDVLEETLTPGSEAVNQKTSGFSDVSQDISFDIPEMNVLMLPVGANEIDTSQIATASSKLTCDVFEQIDDGDTECRANISVETRAVPALDEKAKVAIDQTLLQTNSTPTDVESSAVTLQVAAPVDMLAGVAEHELKVPTLTLYEDVNLDVFVTEVVSPSLFWIQPLSSKLEEMMAELIIYHSKLQPSDAGYRLASQPTPGMLVCACFTRDDNWYRARIISVHTEYTTGSAWELDVLYIDYGNRERTTLDRIRPLPPNFTKLPSHAFTCALAEIAPPDGSTTWQANQSIEFAQMILNGKMLYASFTPPGGDCPLYFVELYHLNPPQTVGMSLMNSVSELLILERKARKTSRDFVVQVFKDTISQDTPPDGALSEILVHQLQTPEFVFHHAVSEKEKDSAAIADNGGVKAMKKALAKERERNRAVRESLRKRKEARSNSKHNVNKTVQPSGATLASASVTSGDDVFSEVMGSSANRLEDDFSVTEADITSTPVTGNHQEAPQNCTTPQSVKTVKNRSTEMDDMATQEVSPTWQTWSSPEPPGGRSVAWETYYQNNTVVIRQDEHIQSDSDQNRSRGQDSAYHDDSQRSKPRSETRSERQGRSNDFDQWRNNQTSETRSEVQDGEHNRCSRSNRGSCFGEISQQRNEQKSEARSDRQDCGYNRANHSNEFSQPRYDQRSGTRCEGQSYEYNRGNRSDEFGQRRDVQRCDTWRGSSERADYSGRADMDGQRAREQHSHRRARNEYQPASPEHRPNATCYSGNGFNRNRSSVKCDSGYGNSNGCASSASRNGNRTSSYYDSGIKCSLGTNNRDIFEDGPRQNRPGFESEKCWEPRRHQDSTGKPTVNTSSAADEEVWDLEPVCETVATTMNSKPAAEEKEPNKQTRHTTKTEKTLWTSCKMKWTPARDNNAKETLSQWSPEVKSTEPVGEAVTTRTDATTQKELPVHIGSTNSHLPENLTKRQMLKERGLPNRLPRSCGFSRQYERFMSGSDGETATGEGEVSQPEDRRDRAIAQEDEVTGTCGEGREEASEVMKQGEAQETGRHDESWVVSPDESRVETVTPDELRVEAVTPNEARVEMVIRDESRLEILATDESRVETTTPDAVRVNQDELVLGNTSRDESGTSNEFGIETVLPDELGGETIILDELGEERVSPQGSGVHTITTDELGVETVIPAELGMNTIVTTDVLEVEANELRVGAVTPEKLRVETVTPNESDTEMPDEFRVEAVTLDELGVEAVTSHEVGVEAGTSEKLQVEKVTHISDEPGVITVAIGELGVETVNNSDELRVATVTSDMPREEMGTRDETGVDTVRPGRGEGEESACCEEVIAGGLRQDVMSHGCDVTVIEECKGNHEVNRKEGSGGSVKGGTQSVGETGNVDVGNTAVPQNNVIDVTKDEKAKAGDRAENVEGVLKSLSSEKVITNKDGVGINKQLDQELFDVEAPGMKEAEEARWERDDITGYEKTSVDKVTDVDFATDAENTESQILSLTLLEVSNTDDSEHVEVDEHLCRVPPGESAERVFSPPEIIVSDDGNIAFMMSYIESPSRFWVHLVTENASSAIESLMHDLNQYYKTANKVMLKKFFEGEDALNLNNICCAQFSEDNDFYRVEIISKRFEVEEMSPKVVSESGDTCRHKSHSRKLAKVKVFYIDFGNSEWLSPKRIYPLPPLFATLAPQAVCCRLVALEPVTPMDSKAAGDGMKDNSLNATKWSSEATQKFMELTGFDKKLFAYTTDKGSILLPTNSHPLDIVVVDTSREEDVWINEELVRLGLAKFSSVFRAVQSQLYKASDEKATKDATGATDLPADWNPLAEDYLSDRNSYFVDVDDPGVATVGIEAEDEHTICHFYNSPGGCWKGTKCRYEHIRKTDTVTNLRRGVYLRNDLESMSSPPQQDSWVAVELTAVSSPSHFYVTFPFGTRPVIELLQDDSTSDEGYEGSSGTLKSEMLDQLLENLNEHYNKRGGFRDTDLTIYASGELVVARFADDGRWYRAKVVDTDPDVSLVKVFYVDFGNVEWVWESSLTQIQPQFLHLPFQAMECILPLVATTEDGTWSPEARKCFTELCEGKVLFAHILSTNSNNIISVELFDTELEEDVNIGQVLVDSGFAKLPDRTTFTRPLSPTPKHTASDKPRYVPG